MLSILHMLSFNFQSDNDHPHFPGEETHDQESNLDHPGLVPGRTASKFQAGGHGILITCAAPTT